MMKRLRVRIRASRIRNNSLLRWNKHIKELERQCGVSDKVFSGSLYDLSKNNQDAKLDEIYKALLNQSFLLYEIASTLMFFKIMYIVIVGSIPVIFLIVEMLK